MSFAYLFGEFWCRTDGDKIESGRQETSIVWQVKNFSSRPEQKGEFIESDSFTVISPEGVATKWKLKLFPKGATSAKAKDGSFSVFSTSGEIAPLVNITSCFEVFTILWLSGGCGGERRNFSISY